MKYYKVVDEITEHVVIDSSKSNYSQTLPHYEIIQNLLDYVVSASESDSLGLDLYIVLNNCMALEGQYYLDRLSSLAVNERFSLESITKNPHHKSEFIQESKIIEIVESLIEIGLPVLENGSYLWEHLYENVRKKEFNHLPNRLNSFFLFGGIDECEYFIRNHKGVGCVCEVEIQETISMFHGDMYLLDSIQNHFTSEEAKSVARKYWQGEKSLTPITEIVFQGKCVLKPMYRLAKDGDNLLKFK